MLVVSAVPAVPSNPGERTLYHPARPTSRIPPTQQVALRHDRVRRLGPLQPVVQGVVAVLLIAPQSLQMAQCSAVICPKTSGAAVQSSADAAVTATTRSNPKVSTMICRFLPVIFLPPS